MEPSEGIVIQNISTKEQIENVERISWNRWRKGDSIYHRDQGWTELPPSTK